MSGAAVVTDVEGYFPCRWDWCRAVFTSLKEGMEHVVVQHINTAPLLTRAEIKLAERLEADHPFSMSEESWLTSTPRPSQQVQPPTSTQQTLSQSQSQSQPYQLLSPPRLSDALPESPAAQSPSPSASGSPPPPSPPKPRASTSRAPLVGYSSRTSSPAPEEPTLPALSFVALSGAGDPSALTPPLQRLPASPTSEEQIYRHLDLDAHAESQSDESVSAAARKRKEPPPSTPQQRAKTVSVAGTPLRRSSRHSTPSVAGTPKSKAKPKSKQAATPRKRHKADGELDDDANLPAIREMEEGEIMNSPPSQLQSQSQSQQPQSEQSQSQSQAQSQSQSQWPSLAGTPTQSLNLATQMPLSQESFEWNLSQ